VAEDVLDDLRQGRLTLEVRQPSVQQAQERLGRRVFAGLVLGSTLISGSILLGSDHSWIGLGMLAAAGGWGLLHTVSMAMSKTRPP
jgi:hypothetical protein